MPVHDSWIAATAFFRVLGPGLIAGSADDDLSGIGTYAIACAAVGYATLWTAVFTIPMMIAVLA
jgi:Mn2+/Fe2+ NRAMP family transporter